MALPLARRPTDPQGQPDLTPQPRPTPEQQVWLHWPARRRGPRQHVHRPALRLPVRLPLFPQVSAPVSPAPRRLPCPPPPEQHSLASVPFGRLQGSALALLRCARHLSFPLLSVIPHQNVSSVTRGAWLVTQMDSRMDTSWGSHPCVILSPSVRVGPVTRFEPVECDKVMGCHSREDVT